jgi:hypothetical protein
MAADFTVIQSVRQRFGDENLAAESPLNELDAPFVGLSKDFKFLCPDVVPSGTAVLQFETLGATEPLLGGPQPGSVVQINGINIPNGIRPGYAGFWKSHNLIVPANVLTEDNVLHIEASVLAIAHAKHFDDFIIDNVVIFYKSKIKEHEDGPVVRDEKVSEEI